MLDNRTHRLAERFAQIAAEVLSQISGQEYQGGLAGGTGREQEGDSILVDMSLRQVVDGKLGLRFGPDLFRAAGTALLGAPVPENLEDSERRQAVEEFWRQVVGRVNTAISGLLNRHELEMSGISESRWNPAAEVAIEIRHSEGGILPCSMLFSSMALKILDRDVEVLPGMTKATSAQFSHENLAILLDIPLAVTLRFGERTLPLRDILQLNSGAVIELDRQAEQPVDLCLEGRVIARGSVVVVEGCYGLRVTEVCRPAKDFATAEALR